MLTKSLIAAAVLSLAALLPAAEAQAKSNINLNIGVGVGGYFAPAYDPYYGGGVVVAYDGVSCSQARNIVRSEGFYKVNSIDCSASDLQLHRLARRRQVQGARQQRRRDHPHQADVSRADHDTSERPRHGVRGLRFVKDYA